MNDSEAQREPDLRRRHANRALHATEEYGEGDERHCQGGSRYDTTLPGFRFVTHCFLTS